MINPKIIIHPDEYVDKLWRLNDGRLHREDGPAWIKYYPDGSVSCEAYYIYGNQHRVDGPSYTMYDEVGKIIMQQYMQNNRLHNENGPSRIDYVDEKIRKTFHYYDKSFQSFSKMRKYIKTLCLS